MPSNFSFQTLVTSIFKKFHLSVASVLKLNVNIPFKIPKHKMAPAVERSSNHNKFKVAAYHSDNVPNDSFSERKVIKYGDIYVFLITLL